MKILSFLIIFLPFSPLDVYPYEIFSHNETEPGYKTQQILNNQNGTTVVYLTKPINETCNESRIDLRIINHDGAVNNVKVNHSIPDFNFCFEPNDESSHTKIYNKQDKIIILYKNFDYFNFASFYALVVDAHTGNVISNTFLSYGELFRSANIYQHVNEKYGFLFQTFLTETKMILKYFNNPDSDGYLELINSNEVELYSSSKFDIFSMADGAFGLITSNHTMPSYNPLIPTLSFYMLSIKPLKNFSVDRPTLFYNTEIRDLQAEVLCDFSYVSLGYTCLLNAKERQLTGTKNYFIKINFQITGSLINVEYLDFELYYTNLGEIIKLINLYHGGYLILSLKNSSDFSYKTIQAIVFDNHGRYNGTLLPENFKVPNDLSMSFLQNTFAIPQQKNKYNWEMYLAEYPKFIKYDNGCDVPFIKSVYPLVDSYIPLSMDHINITYELPVIASMNNISIYQYNNGSPILRQSVGPKSFSLGSNNKVLTLKVLESTFNRPNTEYYIVIDDNVVQSLKENEPLTGIKTNTWKFITTSNEYVFAEDVTGLFALTTEATKYYDGLSHHDQETFLSQLKNDLANSVPVNISRFGNHIEFYQYDKSQDSPRILLSLPIRSTTDKKDLNVNQILKSLNSLIQAKDITIISRFDKGRYLDDKFGFLKIRNLFNDFKLYLIGVAVGVVILILLYCYAKIRCSEAKNFVLFKNPLLLMDFILNISFIIINGKRIKNLFTFSIIFFAIPIVSNTIMTITIIFKETVNNEVFQKWYKSNLKVSILFSILSVVVDIEMLNTLFSRVANVIYFDAPVTDKLCYHIFWAGLIGLIIKDIPRFIIQVYYFRSIAISSYDIVSFISLLISSLVLISKILFRIYCMIYYLYKNKKNFNISYYYLNY